MEKLKNNIIIICLITLIIIIFTIYIINIKTKKTKTTYEQSDTTTWSEENTTVIKVTEENNNISITKGGTYKLTGSSTNGNITINTEEEVTLILDNLELTNDKGPAIQIENAKKTVITLNENTTNKLSDGKNTNQDYNAVIYSKDDLTINGEGTLEIETTFENGIKCNDELKIMSGNININSNTNGIIGKDSVTIKSGNINIKSNGEGIKTNNEEKGNIIIEDANINIESQEDGIEADNDLTITNGTFTITTGNGASELSVKQGWENTNDTEEEISQKAIKATNRTIETGTFNINSNDDGIHSNGNLTINNGTFEIKSSDDGIHADAIVEIKDGKYNITASEGIEATYVKINGGDITINASDDGINAGKKSDEYTPTIEINNGNLTIKMGQGDTDGLDSNGNLYINGGTINITCNSPFDYDLEAKYTGGKMIINGTETNQITNQMMGGMPGQGNMNRGEQVIEGGQYNRDIRR